MASVSVSGPAGTHKPSIKRSLTTRITLLLTLALGALFLGVYLLVLKPAVNEIAQNQLDQAVTRIRYGLAQQLGEVERMLNAGSEWAARSKLTPGDRDTLNTLFMPVIVQSPSITSILYAADDGTEWMLLKRDEGWSNRMTNPRLWHDGVYWFDWTSLVDEAVTRFQERDYDPRLRPWYQTAITAEPNALAWTSPYLFLTTQDPGMTAAKHWLQPDGKPAVLAFDVKLKDLSALTGNDQFAGRGGVVIANHQGQILAISNQPDLLGINSLSDALLQPLLSGVKGLASEGVQQWQGLKRPVETLVHFTADGEEWVAEFNYHPLAAERLLIGVFAPVDSFVPGAGYHAAIMMLLLVFVLLASVLITLRLARHFSTPLQALVETSRRIGALELDAKVEIATPTREFHQLVLAQDQMRQHLLDATEHLEQQVAERTEALSDRLQFQRLLIDLLPNPVFILDEQARFIDINPAYSSAFAVDKSQLIGHDVRALEHIPASSRERYLKKDKQLLKEGGSTFQQLKMRFADGEMHDVLYWARRFDSHGGQSHGLLGLIVDISEQKAAELEAMRARAAAEEAAHAKSDFLANMSHEIRTPMNAIVGFSHLLGQTGLDPQQRGYSDNIDRSAQALLRIINDILDFSKIEAGKLVIEKTELILDEVLATLTAAVAHRASEKGLELLIDVAPEVPDRLCGDPGRLAQILINLVGNAVKFTEQGEVRVSIEALEVGEQRCKLLFRICDSGIGMQPEQMQRLFQPFSQADSSTTRRFGGTGLGLSICKQLVAAMGGEIGVESGFGVGSEFHFVLPFERSSAALSPRIVPAVLSELSVLLVDDNASSREILSRYCSQLGFSVIQAASGQEALDELARNGDNIALVLMDWKMPAPDGIETTALIRARYGPRVPRIIMVTAYGASQLPERMQTLGLDGFLVKPVNPSTLYNAVLEAFADLIVSPQQPAPAESTLPGTLKGMLEGAGTPILVVEDNEINQLLARELLEQVGFEVTLAENGQEALERLQQQRFGLVLMDIQMPVMDGLEATRRIRRQPQWQSLPVIAMTANALASDREECLAVGMNDHLSKPINVAELYRVLGHWLGRASDTDAATGIAGGVPAADAGTQVRGAGRVPAVLDLMQAEAQLGGNQALLQRLIMRFYESRQDSANELQALLAAGDLEGAQRLAHSLKGLSASLGAEQLSQASAELEQQLGAGTLPAPELLLHWRQALQALFTQLQRHLPAQLQTAASYKSQDDSDTNTKVEPGAAQHPELDLARINALKNALEEADFAAVDLLESYQRQAPELPLLDQLKGPIHRYDFDQALKLIEHYLEQKDAMDAVSKQQDELK